MTTRLNAIIDRIGLKTNNTASLSTTVITGVFAGIMMLLMSITYASLIFSGVLSQYLSQGISMAITSVVVVGVLTTLFSSSPHIITQIDDDAAPVFALCLTLLIASLPETLSADQLLLNVLAALFIATIIAGAVLTLFGVFKFGNFVQYLPYSVMGGYFAAVGWLLLVGAIAMLSNIELTAFDSFIQLFTQDTIIRWLPAVLIGLWLRYMSSRVDKGVLIGLTVIITSLSFFGLYWLAGYSPEDLLADSHLLGPFNDHNTPLLKPTNPMTVDSIAWNAILQNMGSIASICLIGLLSFILCISALSLSTRQDLDTNYELKIAGASNITSALMGGMMALPSLSISKLSYDIHPSENRLIGLIAILVGVIMFYYGMGLIAYLPKIVMGSLLIYIGLGFVIEWIIEGYRRFGALEYSVIPIILIVSISAGFLQSIVTGIFAAIILFVVKYSRIKIIRYQASGADLRSNIVRDLEQNKVLHEHGDQVRLFTLQGYLFFGTAGSLYRSVLNCVNNPDNKELKYVILDFSQVIGVDSSATLNFEKLAQRLFERKIYLITTSLKPGVLEILRRGGLDLDNNSYLIQHIDVDQGMEWCENYILKEQAAEARVRRGVFERVANGLSNSDQLPKLTQYLEKIDVEAGHILARYGEESNEVFFLETCTASAYILDSDGKERRVSGAGRGAIFGEIGFFLGIPRTALVRADTAGEIYSLSTKALNEMEKDEPELAAAITRYLAQTVTERLVNTTNSLRAIL